MDHGPIKPPQLDLRDSTILDQLASTISDCLVAFSAGERVRGMDPLMVLSVLAELAPARVEGH